MSDHLQAEPLAVSAPDTSLFVRPLHPGMGQAVAERTVLRRKPDGLFESWGEVAARVATGNALLHEPSFAIEKPLLERHIAKATLLMSGRHLQHGDAEQPKRNMEVFTNCSTAATSWLLFTLLLNGSGVGRCYDDDFMVTNWDNAPNLRCVISSSHADFDWSGDEDARDARHKYRGETVHWHAVADSREGWGKAIEIWELMAHQKIYRDHTLVLDFSQVRPRGAPIRGMQNRPSSGPKPLMNALMKCASIKGAGMKPWMQAMYVDHYLAECVLVGGARRAARMATKFWRDPTVLDFIRVKRPIEYDGLDMAEVIVFRAAEAAAKRTPPFAFLWSSNNSVTADAEFWEGVQLAQETIAAGRHLATLPKDARHAWKVLNALAEAAYGDGTGEPGIINVDKLRQNETGWAGLEDGGFVGSAKYAIEEDSRLMLSRLAKLARKKHYHMITNPCGEIALTVLGGYCVIADVVPFHADTLDEAEEAFRVATRALMRVNLMDSLYDREVKRTNRIGVGMTGVHEFAWKFFRVGFRDLVRPDFAELTRWDEGRAGFSLSDRGAAAAFWMTLARFSRAVQDEAARYAAELGVAVPHTNTTIKPAGTTSKLFGLTEGWHLPAMAWYLRWVQFRHDDPLVASYREAGYPVRELKSYSGTVIVGFPTQPTIGTFDMGDALVTASEATPEEQYEWLRLGERFWIVGTDKNGKPLHPEGEDLGNQISYTLKYDPAVVSYEHFRAMLIEHQSQIRCCSVLPVTDTSAYEYLPEEAINKAQYEGLSRAVAEAASGVVEEIGFEHIDCGAGGCPVDFKEDKGVDTADPLTPALVIYEGDEEAPAYDVYGYHDGSCPWCDQALNLLLNHGLTVEFHDVKDEVRKAAFFAANPSVPRTVPQIWERAANGIFYIGGYTDLLKHLGVQPE